MHDPDGALAQEWYDQKSALMASMLGQEHDVVMHAIIPYAIGGGLDLYYFPNGIPGTAIATKELSDYPETGSSNDVYKTYELVMFTRNLLALQSYADRSTPFGRVHDDINAILGYVAPYSAEATLNPNETCEFPGDMERVGGKCLIFDGYPSYQFGSIADFGLLLIIEIFRSEMEHARKVGGEKLLRKLKAHGHYPYSDLDREPVV